MSVTEASLEMSADHNTSGTFTLLLSLDVKFVNIFQNKLSILTHTIKFLHILVTGLQSTITEIPEALWFTTYISLIMPLSYTLQTVMFDAQLSLQS